MLIARELQNKNRAEYLLYMWQVEDIIRSYGADIDKLNENYLSQFGVDEAQMQELRTWYADLCNMMREEGKMEKGHLQICNNVIIGLEDVHEQLLASTKFPYYRNMYHTVLPYIVELRAMSGASASNVGEIEHCFEVLYGIVLLRLQQKDISAETQQAAQHISQFLGQLSDYYFKQKEGTLELD